MSDLKSCPNCNRCAENGFSSNWFPVHSCDNCGKKFCKKCGDSYGEACPKCGSKKYTDKDKVYA